MIGVEFCHPSLSTSLCKFEHRPDISENDFYPMKACLLEVTFPPLTLREITDANSSVVVTLLRKCDGKLLTLSALKYDDDGYYNSYDDEIRDSTFLSSSMRGPCRRNRDDHKYVMEVEITLQGIFRTNAGAFFGSPPTETMDEDVQLDDAITSDRLLIGLWHKARRYTRVTPLLRWAKNVWIPRLKA
jgi:hypothetical protein